MAPHLKNEDFFIRLSELFESRRDKDHGAIHLVQKRLTHTDSTASQSGTKPSHDDFSDLTPASPLPILIRATNGKSKKNRTQKVKLSTIVNPDDVGAFFARYGDICKGGMGALKKRDRSKRKKTKKKA